MKTLLVERRAIRGGACVTQESPSAPGYWLSFGAVQFGNLCPQTVAILELEKFGYALILSKPLAVFAFADGRYLAL